jgi:hypothetical protein
MVKPLKTLVLIIFCLSSPAYAGMKVSVYEKEKNTDSFKIYMTGVANGFAFANTELEAKKQKAIYCPPRNESIKVETYIKLLDEKIKIYPKDKYQSLEIEPILLTKLIEVYPCK